MSEELKPCPFCGGEAKIIYITDKNYNNISVTCTTCFAGMHLFNDEQEAIDIWNTRVLTPYQKHAEELFEGLSKMLDITGDVLKALSPLFINLTIDNFTSETIKSAALVEKIKNEAAKQNETGEIY